MNRAIIVDASVALKWVLDEDDSHLARALAERNLAAPDLLWSECANGLWRWVVRRALPRRVALERFAILRHAPVVTSLTAMHACPASPQRPSRERSPERNRSAAFSQSSRSTVERAQSMSGEQ